MKQLENDFKIQGLFPSPLYFANLDSGLDLTEEKEIEDIIKEGLHENHGNGTTINSYIFNTKLKGLKEFCERHINTYVKQIINPKEELDFYITQSWINVTEPGGGHHAHSHYNSIISGVFYISTVEEDKIAFTDPNVKLKEVIRFEEKDYTPWNSISWFVPIEKNNLLLFPSWLNHRVDINEKATKDRISISFNTFARGVFGDRKGLTELIL